MWMHTYEYDVRVRVCVCALDVGWVVNAPAFDETLSPSQFAFTSRYHDRLSARPAFAAAMDI